MKPSSVPPRTPSTLSDSVHHRLDMYASAASAAGVGILALGQPAEAKVVYTPAHNWLPVNQYFYLDLNHDGRTVFRFFLQSRRSSQSNAAYDLTVEPGIGPGAKNAVYSYKSANASHCGAFSTLFCAAALPKGVKVGPNSPFPAAKSLFMFESAWEEDCSWVFGQWLDVTKQAFLGLKFVINGEVHYGWARMGHISHRGPVKVELTGYAYETTPNKPIVTGKTKGTDVITVGPATLGMLAQGRK